MIPQDCHDRESQPDQRIEQSLHLRWLAVVSEVTGEDEEISLVANLYELLLYDAEAWGEEVQISGSGDSHALSFVLPRADLSGEAVFNGNRFD
jgi:hypothetical protein